MNISKLRTEFLKTRTEESKKCLNFCVSQRIYVLACSVKLRDIFFLENYTTDLSLTIKILGKTVGPLFSEKTFHKKSFILDNNNKAY